MSMNGNGAITGPQVLIAEGVQVSMVKVNATTPAVGFAFVVQGQQIVMCCPPGAAWEEFAANLIRAADHARAGAVPVAVAQQAAEPVPVPESRCWQCGTRIFGDRIEQGGCVTCGPMGSDL